jgi:hypothetical protein
MAAVAMEKTPMTIAAAPAETRRALRNLRARSLSFLFASFEGCALRNGRARSLSFLFASLEGCALRNGRARTGGFWRVAQAARDRNRTRPGS